MNLYLLERNDKVWYDQYEGAVVAATSIRRAYEMGRELFDDNGYGPEKYTFSIEDIGVSNTDVEEFIIKSFKAG